MKKASVFMDNNGVAHSSKESCMMADMIIEFGKAPEMEQGEELGAYLARNKEALFNLLKPFQPKVKRPRKAKPEVAKEPKAKK